MKNSNRQKTNVKRTDSFGASVGPLKFWLRSQHPGKLAFIAVSAIGVCYGIVSWIKDLVNKSQTKTRMEERTHDTNEKIRETEAKCQAEAEKYDKKVESVIRKAETLYRMRNTVQENLTTESTVESPASNQKKDETFMQSFNRKHKMPYMPPIIDDVLVSCPEGVKMPLLLATLSEFGALCFPRVITKGWHDGEIHRSNIQVVIEGPAGVGKGRIFKAYKTLFQRVIAKDEVKGGDDPKKKKQHIIQYVGANTTSARLIRLFRENNGVPIFVFNEEIKDITRSLNKQKAITYDMLRKAFDNGATDGSSSRGNTDPTPVSVRMNYVFTGTIGDVADFINGEVEGGTAARILWGVLEADKKNESPDEASGSSLESYLDDIDCWRKLYCYTTDSNGNEYPCDETCIDLEYVKVELERWRQKQESNSSLSCSDVRKKVAKRMTSLGLHCAIPLHMLFMCQMGEVDTYHKKCVIDAVLYIAEYSMERYIFKFGEEEQAIIQRDINAEKIHTSGGSSTRSVPDQNKENDFSPEIQEKIKSLYIPRECGHKAVAKKINRIYNTNFKPDKVRRFLEREGLYQPIAPNKP